MKGEAAIMKRKMRILLIISSVITLIGLISFIAQTRGVNSGAFIFPGIITLVLFFKYKKIDANQ